MPSVLTWRARRSKADDLAAAFSLYSPCEPAVFRRLTREWPDRDTAAHITEVVHRKDLERAAARPPVIEVTVTTPPGGIPRAELARLVQARLQRVPVAGPALEDTQIMPAVRP